MKKLTDITWPLIHQLAANEIEKQDVLDTIQFDRCEADVVVVEAAVMLEAGWIDLVDEVDMENKSN